MKALKYILLILLLPGGWIYFFMRMHQIKEAKHVPDDTLTRAGWDTLVIHERQPPRKSVKISIALVDQDGNPRYGR